MWNDIRKNSNNGLIQKPELLIHSKNKSFHIKKEQNIDSEIRKHSDLFRQRINPENLDILIH